MRSFEVRSFFYLPVSHDMPRSLHTVLLLVPLFCPSTEDSSAVGVSDVIVDDAVSTAALAAMDDVCADCMLIHQCISDTSPLRVSASLYRRSDDQIVQVRATRPWRTVSWLVEEPRVVSDWACHLDCADAVTAVEDWVDARRWAAPL